MNLLKKFKDFFRNEFGPAIHNGTKFITIDGDEMTNICQDLMDEFGFNEKNNQIYISLSNYVGEYINTTYNELISAGFKKDLRIPVVYGDPLLFRIEFSKPVNSLQFSEFVDDEDYKFKFTECVEELINRMEDAFPIELFDESEKFIPTSQTLLGSSKEAHRNSAYRIVRKNGNLVWKKSTQISNNTTKNLENISLIPNEFILAFKLKKGYEPDKKV